MIQKAANLSLDTVPSSSVRQKEPLRVRETTTIGLKYCGQHLTFKAASIFLLRTRTRFPGLKSWSQIEWATQCSKLATEAKRLHMMRSWICCRSSSHLASWRAQDAISEAVSSLVVISGTRKVTSMMSRGRSGSTP